MIISIKELFHPHGTIIRKNGKKEKIKYRFAREKDGSASFIIVDNVKKSKKCVKEVAHE